MAKKQIALISTGGTIEKTYDAISGLLANSVSVLDIMLDLMRLNGIENDEMFNTFNMGIGFALITSPESASSAIDLLAANGHSAFTIGEIVEGSELRIAS